MRQSIVGTSIVGTNQTSDPLTLRPWCNRMSESNAMGTNLRQQDIGFAHSMNPARQNERVQCARSIGDQFEGQSGGKQGIGFAHSAVQPPLISQYHATYGLRGPKSAIHSTIGPFFERISTR